MAKIMFSFDVCACICVRLYAAALNANSSKTVKATDFKFDMHVPMGSPDMTLYKFFETGRRQCHVTPKFLGVKC